VLSNASRVFILVEQEGDEDAGGDEASEDEDSEEHSSEDNLSDIDEDDDKDDDGNDAAAAADDDNDEEDGLGNCESPPKKRVRFADAVDIEKPKMTVGDLGCIHCMD